VRVPARSVERLRDGHMDEIDKQIINRIQSDFPITSRPFLELGKQFRLTEAEVMDRVGRLKREGVIRRIGGNFHSSRLDFASTLCAAKVPPEKIEAFVEVVNQYPGVTHNYLREHDYNVWFTFIARDMAEIEGVLKTIAEETGVPAILNLPAVRTFKIKVDFEV
jgi:DNA-binding Lrp family transcriptional regulator